MNIEPLWLSIKHVPVSVQLTLTFVSYTDT